jgi:hypothetical protein
MFIKLVFSTNLIKIFDIVFVFFFSEIAKHMLETILKHHKDQTYNQIKMIVQNVDHSQTK